MSKLHTVFALAAILLAYSPGNCQAYEVRFSEAPYEPLDQYTQLNQSPWPQWHSFKHVPIDFSFSFFDRQFESLQLEISSRLVFDEGHFYFFDPLAMVALEDAGKGSSESKSLIAYHSSGDEGSRVFTIEYRDVRLARDTSLFVNFQVRLYEKDHSLELHMGAHSNIKPNTHLQLGPYAGVYHLKSVSPIDFDYAINLVGSPSEPEIRNFSGQGVPYLNYTLNALPKEGQVIRYVPELSSSLEEVASQQALYLAYGANRLHNHSAFAHEIKVYNLLGKCCLQSAIAPNASLPLDALPRGTYLIVSPHQTLKILL